MAVVHAVLAKVGFQTKRVSQLPGIILQKKQLCLCTGQVPYLQLGKGTWYIFLSIFCPEGQQTSHHDVHRDHPLPSDFF